MLLPDIKIKALQFSRHRLIVRHYQSVYLTDDHFRIQLLIRAASRMHIVDVTNRKWLELGTIVEAERFL